jgi:filamentous hemagglutinin family protein
MHKNLSGVAFPLLGSLTVSGILIFSHNQVLAQVTPDNTLGDESSVVNTRDATSDSIDGGAIRGQNLFHSFQEFNVGEDRGVYFSNPEAVNNIFSRVTGNNVSNILGTLGVDGAANLFLINPNGIIFGEGASLDVQGSFAATTAESILFENGREFSAVDPQKQILDIKVPLGLQMGSNPGSIVYRSISINPSTNIPLGLQVRSGENLSLIGGEVSLDGGIIFAPGGRVDLGGLNEAGTIGINNDGSLNFPKNVEKDNVFLRNGSVVAVFSEGGGSIAINSKNLELTEGSSLRAGIAPGLGSPEAQAGDIVINAADKVTFDGVGANGLASGIDNSVRDRGTGNAGKIELTTSDLSFTNGGTINSTLSGTGNIGDIIINASNNIFLDSNSLIGNQLAANGIGDTGNIDISGKNFSLTNGGSIRNSIVGKGTSGKIVIDTGNTISINGASPQSPSAIFSTAGSLDEIGGEGDAGGIDITSKQLDITNGGVIGSLVTETAKGNSGDITINASDRVSLDGATLINNQPSFSSITSNVLGIGNSGDINIFTNNLSLTHGVRIGSETLNRGNAGNIDITATDSIVVDNSTIASNAIPDSMGNGGNIDIFTGNIKLNNNSNIGASNTGEGNAGNIQISATKKVILDRSSLGSIGLAGGAGKIKIKSPEISLDKKSEIGTSNLGIGNAGNISIEARDLFSASNGSIIASNIGREDGTPAEGKVGNITITAKDVSFSSGAQLQAGFYSNSQGESGRVSVKASDSISFDGRNSSILTNVESEAIANGSDIKLEAQSISFTNGVGLTASNSGTGNSGNISIKANKFSTANDILILSNIGQEDGTPAEGKVGSIAIEADKVSFSDRSQIQAGFFSKTKGESGSVSIKATDSISFDGISGIFTNVDLDAIASGGDIQLEANSISFTNTSGVTASNSGQGNAGNIKVNSDTFTLDNNSAILASNNPSADISTTLSGGNIDLEIADQLTLRTNSDISTEASINANGGNIDITADSIIAFDDSDIFAFAADGQGGNITLNTPAYFAENFTLNSLTSDPQTLVNNSRADINATGAVSGSVDIPDVSFIQNSLTELANDSLNTDELVANSCVVPVGDRKEGKFIITGTESLPVRPGDGIPSQFPTGEVRSVPGKHSSWQPGDPIVEPQGAYRLANGKLVLSRECSQ